MVMLRRFAVTLGVVIHIAAAVDLFAAGKLDGIWNGTTSPPGPDGAKYQKLQILVVDDKIVSLKVGINFRVGGDCGGNWPFDNYEIISTPVPVVVGREFLISIGFVWGGGRIQWLFTG